MKPVEETEEGFKDGIVHYGHECTLSDSAILNKPNHHHTAAIAHKLTLRVDARYDKEKKEITKLDSSIDGTVWISDCSRSINLQLEVYNKEEEVDNSLYKLDTLIKELKKCKKNLKQLAKQKAQFDHEMQTVFKYVPMDKVFSDIDKFKEEVNS